MKDNLLFYGVLILGFIGNYTFGYFWGVRTQQDEIKELQTQAETLEKEKTEYKWLYESCQTTFGDYQDKVESGCFVDGGWNCE